TPIETGSAQTPPKGVKRSPSRSRCERAHASAHGPPDGNGLVTAQKSSKAPPQPVCAASEQRPAGKGGAMDAAATQAPRPVLNPARTWKQAHNYAKMAGEYVWIELQTSRKIRSGRLTSTGPKGSTIERNWPWTDPDRWVDTADFGATQQQRLRELLGPEFVATGELVENTSCWGVHGSYGELFLPLNGRRAGDAMGPLGKAGAAKDAPPEVRELAKRLIAYAMKDLDAVWSVE